MVVGSQSLVRVEQDGLLGANESWLSFGKLNSIRPDELPHPLGNRLANMRRLRQK
jgi:hypothetical protein